MSDITPTSVYLYYDYTGVLIYVGVTSRGSRRQAEHNGSKDWWEFVDTQSVEHFADRPAALRRERELIVKHTPPFNTQHNKHHRELRAAYLEFRVSQAVRLTLPEAIATRPDRRIELDLHETNNWNSTLRTRMEDAQIAMALELSAPVRTYGFSKSANVNRIEQVGPVVLLHLTRRIGKPLQDAHAVVYCNEKKPLSVAHLRVVQIRTVKSEVA